MGTPIYAPSSHDLSNKRQKLASENEKAFHAFSRQVFADGALPGKTKQIVAVAVAHVTQCPYCIRSHLHMCRQMWPAPGPLRAGLLLSSGYAARHRRHRKCLNS